MLNSLEQLYSFSKKKKKKSPNGFPYFVFQLSLAILASEKGTCKSPWGGGENDVKDILKKIFFY